VPLVRKRIRGGGKGKEEKGRTSEQFSPRFAKIRKGNTQFAAGKKRRPTTLRPQGEGVIPPSAETEEEEGQSIY